MTQLPLLEDQPARDRITDDLDATLFVEAGAGSGKTRSLVDRVVALVGSGRAEMRGIAAITFTEKAAAELHDRIRRAFERGADNDPPQRRRRFRAALDQLDGAAVSTLHAFAQRILTEHPVEAGLPPAVEVTDEVTSQIEFEQRWDRFRDDLLDAPELERCLLLAFAAGIRLDDLRYLATAFNDNWDLIADPQRIPWGRNDVPACDAAGLLADLEALLARRSECSDGGDLLLAYLDEEVAPFRDLLADAPDEYAVMRLVAEDKPTLRFAHGRKGNWADKQSVRDQLTALREARIEQAGAVQLAALRRIAVELRDFTLAAAEQRRASGLLEFHDLLVMARELLRGEHGVHVRAALARRYQRLLLDEFQDTDPIQIELATLLASDDPDAGDRPWEDITTAPGRLFFVGDPKQSIYRFRRADIGLFLRARRAFGERVSLTTNFRTTPPVIDWVNHVLGRLICEKEGSQPGYEPLVAAPGRGAPPDGQPVVLLGVEEHADAPLADTLREREAADVADAVETALTWQVSERLDDGSEKWRDATLGDITILLPARTSLPALERALERRAIPYRAESSSLVYSTRAVRDLLLTARALADPTDELALVSALRSPVFGCGDDDLFGYRVTHGGTWHVHADPPDTLDGGHPVVQAMGYLRDVASDLPWLSPSEVLDRVARDRRLFELGYADGRPRDLWRRLRFVIDQARAWSESEGGTLRQYLGWARLQASESARVAETILPETDDDSVRIMTVHAAKGLEFPVTILSGMTTATQGRRQRVEVTFPPDGALGMKVGKGITTPEFDDFKPLDEQMDFHERLRLLYVACTRARDHLVVSLHRRPRAREPAKQGSYTNAELIALQCAGAPHQRELAPASPDGRGGARDTAGSALPPLDEWDDQRRAALLASGRRRSVGATDVGRWGTEPTDGTGPIGDGAASGGEGGGDATAGGAVDGEVAAGLDKQPRDLELPPWMRGRYGTAVGRAVHAVLQTIDLATGEGLDEAAAAQAAAEGVTGREGDIASLARSALESPAVRGALAHDRWRETYVATVVAGRTLEGYIDLLYRTDEGLVVVDYKTAAAGTDLDRRLDDYRLQGGAYAVAVEGATGERVARVVFVFLTPDGPVDRVLADLDGVTAEVRAGLAAASAAV